MNTVKKVLQQLKQYKRDTFLCITLTGLEEIGYTTLCFVYGPHQRFQGTKVQTNRATVFARIHENLDLLREIGHRMHMHGNEKVTMTCIDE